MAAFNVQHISYDTPSTGGAQTLTAVVENNTVSLNTNNRFVSGGSPGDTTAFPADEASIGIDLTSATNLNFNREANALRITRSIASVLEYVGQAGGPNEIIVRGRGTAAITAGNRTTTAICDTTPTDIDKCVVHITGYSNSSGLQSRNNCLSGIPWLSGTETINFERGGATGTTTFYYTVVEYTGSNWIIHHGFQTDTTLGTGNISLTDAQKGTGTASTVAAWNKAFIVGYFKADDADTNVNIDDIWPIYEEGANTGTVDWTFFAGHIGADNQHLVYVIENSDTNFSVAKYDTGTITGVANEHVQAITAVNDLTKAIVICSVINSGTGTGFMLGARSAGFNSATEAYSYCHRIQNNERIYYQVIDLDGMDDGVVVAEKTYSTKVNISRNRVLI